MSKRKDAVALFDLINKGRTEQASPGLNVPGWFSKRGAPAPTPPGAEMPEPLPEMPVAEGQPPALPAAPVAAPQISSFAPAAPSEPFLTRADGRVKFSLNYIACAATAMGLIAVLLGTFWLGRVTAARSNSALNPTPARGGGGDGNLTSGAGGGAAPERVKGKWYLIIDRMAGRTDKDWDDAKAIVDYCQAHNEKATIVNLGTQCFAVWSLKPFDDPGSKEAMDYAKAISELGANYRGKYHFSQYSGTGASRKLSPSYIKQKD